MTRNVHGSFSDSPQRFPATPWSLVFAAAQSEAPDSREALATLCQSYWHPLYAFVRRTGHGRDNAQDLVQGFFARFLEKNYLRGRSPAQGRFRSYMLSAFKHFLANEYDRSRAVRRGGGQPVLSLDVLREEHWLPEDEPTTETTPETIYDKRWALLLLDRALVDLRREFEAAGKPQDYQVLEGFLPGGRQSMTYQEAAERMGRSVGAVKVAIHRLRRKYREHLRKEVARTVSEPGEIDPEIRYLIDVLGR